MRYAYKDTANGNQVISTLSSLEGCDQVCVSHSTFLIGDKGKGSGSKAHRDRINKMLELGYDSAICTVVASNEAQNKIMDKFGWVKVHSFKSSKTGNTVQVYVLDLTKLRAKSI